MTHGLWGTLRDPYPTIPCVPTDKGLGEESPSATLLTLFVCNVYGRLPETSMSGVTFTTILRRRLDTVYSIPVIYDVLGVPSSVWTLTYDRFGNPPVSDRVKFSVSARSRRVTPTRVTIDLTHTSVSGPVCKKGRCRESSGCNEDVPLRVSAPTPDV